MLGDIDRQALMKRAAGPIGLIGAVGGFVGDIIAPLGNFAPLVAVGSLAIFIVSAVIYSGMRKRPGLEANETWVPIVMFMSAGSAAIFALWSILFAAGPENGYLAHNIEPIAEIQTSLLGLEEDVAAIRTTTQETGEQVELIATEQAESFDESQAQTAAIATAQAQGFADIQAAFANLQTNQTLVEAPQTPQDFYSNARIYQLGGDTQQAIEAYAGYTAFGLEYVDPLQEYVNLLKASEGIVRTQQIIDELWSRNPENATLELMSVLLLNELQSRIEGLQLLTQREVQYAPAFYELGLAHSADFRVNATQNAAESASAAFESLLKLEQSQLFSRFYIDKSLAQSRLSGIEEELAVMAKLGEQEIKMQISFWSNEGANFFVLPPEADVQELLISIDDPVPAINPGTQGGAPVNQNIGPIPFEPGPHTLYAQYTDVNGVTSDVSAFEFFVDEIVFNISQQPYDFSANGIPVLIVAVMQDPVLENLYTYNYSLNNDALDRVAVGVSIGTPIETEALEPGEHTLYIKAIGDGIETDVVEYSFTVTQ